MNLALQGIRALLERGVKGPVGSFAVSGGCNLTRDRSGVAMAGLAATGLACGNLASALRPMPSSPLEALGRSTPYPAGWYRPDLLY